MKQDISQLTASLVACLAFHSAFTHAFNLDTVQENLAKAAKTAESTSATITQKTSSASQEIKKKIESFPQVISEIQFAQYLQKAIEGGYLNQVNELLTKMGSQKSTLVNKTDAKGLTPLMEAVNVDSVDIVKALVASGANPNIKAVDGKTILHLQKNTPAGREIQNILRPLLNEEITSSYQVEQLGNQLLDTLSYFREGGITHNLLDEFERKYRSKTISRAEDVIARSGNLKKRVVNYQDINGLFALIRAAQFDDSKLFKKLVEAGADVNLKMKDGRSLSNFIKNTAQGTEMIKIMLPQLDQATTSKLFVDALKNNPSRVAVLVTSPHKSQFINLTDSEGITPLLNAIKVDNVDLVTTLINAGADPNIAPQGKTAFDFLKKSPNGDAIFILIRPLMKNIPASVQQQSTQAYVNKLHEAANKADLAQIKKILADVGAGKTQLINTPDDKGITPLMKAAQTGSLDVVKELQQNGADLNMKAKDQKTVIDFIPKTMNGIQILSFLQPFMPAITQALLIETYATYLRSLLDGSAANTIKDTLTKAGPLAAQAINLPNAQGMNALMLATNLDKPNEVQVFVDAGANIAAKNPEGKTAISFIKDTANGIKIFTILAKKNPELVNSKDAKGKTKLMAATEYDKPDDVQALLALNADVNIKTADNKMAMHFIKNSANGTKILTLLMPKMNADLAFPVYVALLQEAATKKNLDRVKALLANLGSQKEKVVNYQDPNANNFTALMKAVEADAIDIIKELKANGAKLDLTTKDGHKADYYAKSTAASALLK